MCSFWKGISPGWIAFAVNSTRARTGFPKRRFLLQDMVLSITWAAHRDNRSARCRAGAENCVYSDEMSAKIFRFPDGAVMPQPVRRKTLAISLQDRPASQLFTVTMQTNDGGSDEA